MSMNKPAHFIVIAMRRKLINPTMDSSAKTYSKRAPKHLLGTQTETGDTFWVTNMKSFPFIWWDGFAIVKPKQAGTCGRSIRNEHTSKSLICTNIKCYWTYSIYSLSRSYAILLSITKKTAHKWKFGIVDDTSCFAHKCQLVLALL